MDACVKWTPNETSFFKGGRGVLPRFFWLLGSQMVHSSAILGHCTPIPLPPPLQKNVLSRFTLISRMVLGVGKKSEIRLKSENFDPWISKEQVPHPTKLKADQPHLWVYQHNPPFFAWNLRVITIICSQCAPKIFVLILSPHHGQPVFRFHRQAQTMTTIFGKTIKEIAEWNVQVPH